MEPDRPDPWEPIVRLLKQLSSEVQQPLTDWLGGLTTDDVRAYAGLADAQGTALPVAIHVEPTILKLSGGEVTLSTGTATGNLSFTGHARGTVPQAPPHVVRWPPEAVRAALVLYVLGWVALICHPDPDPIPADVNALIGAALALLAWLYPRPQQ